jgi:histone H3/H4
MDITSDNDDITSEDDDAKFAIPRKEFKAYFESLARAYNPGVEFEECAIDAVHEFAEKEKLIPLMAEAELVRRMNKGKVVTQKDMILAACIRGDRTNIARGRG